METKTCSSCKQIKDTTEFHNSKKAKDGKMPVCKHCDKVRIREMRYKNLYKITKQQYDDMYISQGGNCMLCQTPKEVLCVDHNHVTGKVRGLLCRQCNYELGKYENNPSLLARTTDYLSGIL